MTSYTCYDRSGELRGISLDGVVADLLLLALNCLPRKVQNSGNLGIKIFSREDILI